MTTTRNTQWRMTILTLGVGALGAILATPVAFAQGYLVYLITTVAIWTIVALGVNLIIGYTGQLVLGHGGLYAIGAYTCALLITKLGFPVWAAIVAAGLMAMTVGMLFAFPALRVSGLYLALVTFGLALIVQLTAIYWVSLTNGPYGVQIPLEALGFMGLGKDLGVYYLSVTLATVGYFVMWLLLHSSVGRSFIAIRESEIAAGAVGINVTTHKIAAFGISAFYVGIAGALYAILVTYISPAEFGVLLTLDTMFVVLVGGLGSLPGPLLGAIFFRLFPEMVRPFKEYQQLIFGLFILLLLVYAPDGLVGLWQQVRDALRTDGKGPSDVERERGTGGTAAS